MSAGTFYDQMEQADQPETVEHVDLELEPISGERYAPSSQAGLASFRRSGTGGWPVQ